MQNLKSANPSKDNKLLQKLSRSQFKHIFQLPQNKSKSFYGIVFAEKNYIDKKKFNLDNLKDSEYSNIEYFDKQKQRGNLENISYISDYQDPIKDYTVGKTLPKCGVEDFYPNGNPSLPDPKKIQNTINEYIKEEAQKGSEEMQNKFICVMGDEHFNIFYQITYSPPVALNIIPFGFQPPTDEQIKKIFDADSKNGNLAFMVADAKEKKVYGCLGVRFRSAQMPSKKGGYKEMIVPEVWSKMSTPSKGAMALLRKIQEEVYNSGFVISYARVGNHAYEKYANFHKTTEKYLKMIPSLSVPGAEGVAIDVQTFYGYKDKTKADITKDEIFFLDNLAIQLANISPSAKKAINSKQKTSNEFMI